MTKEITKANILQEMQDKFKLRELSPEVFTFSEQVIPTYNIEQHLEKWESNYKRVTVTTTGSLLIKEVPPNEKWLLRSYSSIFVTGAYTIAGVYIFRNTRATSYDFSYLDLTAAQNTSYLRTLPESVVLEPGDQIKINVDGYTTTGNFDLHWDFMREEIR